LSKTGIDRPAHGFIQQEVRSDSGPRIVDPDKMTGETRISVDRLSINCA
jgi:hypothetical protein